MRGDAVSVGVYVCNEYVHDSVQVCGECMMGLCMTVVSTGVGMCSV